MGGLTPVPVVLVFCCIFLEGTVVMDNGKNVYEVSEAIENQKPDIPDGWAYDIYKVEGAEWIVAYSSSSETKILYVDGVRASESEGDKFSFEVHGESVDVERRLGYGFYELDIVRAGESIASVKPKRTKIKGKKANIMIAVYMLFALWAWFNFKDTLIG